MLKQSPINARLEHTSYWMQPWARSYIRQAAQLTRTSQAAVLNAIIIDHWLRSLPRSMRTDPQYEQTRRYVDLILRPIR